VEFPDHAKHIGTIAVFLKPFFQLFLIAESFQWDTFGHARSLGVGQLASLGFWPGVVGVNNRYLFFIFSSLPPGLGTALAIAQTMPTSQHSKPRGITLAG